MDQRDLLTLNGSALPRIFWMPFRAVVMETGVERTVWIAAATVCSSWRPLETDQPIRDAQIVGALATPLTPNTN